jgi:hypothetical protein
MIDEIDQLMVEWVASVVPDAEVVFDAPRASSAAPTVHLYLIALQNAVPTRRDHPRAYEIALRYLVAVSAPQPQVAHRLLGQLLVAGLDRADLQVEMPALSPEFWVAFGVAPQPAFLLQRPLTVERPMRAPRVRYPAEVQVVPVGELSGLVLTPDDVPVVRARVELPDLHASTFTDGDGRFRFGAVPAHAQARRVRVVAKGTELVVSRRSADEQPFVIRFQPMEA